jgi:hypothetical protein
MTRWSCRAHRAAYPAAAASEWEGGFLDDIAGYLDDALIEQAVEHSFEWRDAAAHA